MTRDNNKTPTSLTVIGMSGLGKSYWSKQLAQHAGFERFGCDQRIDQAVVEEIKCMGTNDSPASWLGQPYSPHFAEREAIYLNLESSVMQDAVSFLRAPGAPQRRLVDTGGSVIYVATSILDELRAHSRIVCLDFSPESVESLYQQYLAKPRPVVWRDHYQRRDDESDLQALARCYKLLLKSRGEAYRALADVIIPFDEYRKEDFTVDRFLQLALA
jgi:shikimate kinase